MKNIILKHTHKHHHLDLQPIKTPTMPKELNLTHPLVEAQKMIADFLCSVTHAELDLKRLSQLIEMGQQEIERGKDNGLQPYAVGAFNHCITLKAQKYD